MQHSAYYIKYNRQFLIKQVPGSINLGRRWCVVGTRKFDTFIKYQFLAFSSVKISIFEKIFSYMSSNLVLSLKIHRNSASNREFYLHV
jgi:hypothetical protein